MVALLAEAARASAEASGRGAVRQGHTPEDDRGLTILPPATPRDRRTADDMGLRAARPSSGFVPGLREEGRENLLELRALALRAVVVRMLVLAHRLRALEVVSASETVIEVGGHDGSSRPPLGPDDGAGARGSLAENVGGWGTGIQQMSVSGGRR